MTKVVAAQVAVAAAVAFATEIEVAENELVAAVAVWSV